LDHFDLTFSISRVQV